MTVAQFLPFGPIPDRSFGTMGFPYFFLRLPGIQAPKLISIFQPFMPKGPSNWYDPQAFEQHAAYPVDPTRAYLEVLGLLAEMRAGLPRVTAPALLIYSKNDETVTAEEKHMEQIYAALGSQDKHSLWVKNSSHVITEDAARQEVFQAVAHFVARLDVGEV